MITLNDKWYGIEDIETKHTKLNPRFISPNPPPNKIDRTAVVAEKSSDMFPLRTSHTESNTDNKVSMFSLTILKQRLTSKVVKALYNLWKS